jgi:trehalose utilization protein
LSGAAVRVLIWDEHTGVPAAVYPDGIRGAVARGLQAAAAGRFSIRTGHIDEPGQGLSTDALDGIEVLVWWGHKRHEEVNDRTVDTIAARVHDGGLGLVVLHSGHYAKVFRRCLGCSGDLQGGWDEDGGPEQLRVAAPDHPVAGGVDDFILPCEELYAAPFDVPPPECVVLQSHFPKTGKHFPSCLTWTVGRGVDPDFMASPARARGQGRGAGRVVYLRPGHEDVPSLFDGNLQRVIANAVLWAARRTG